MAGDSAGFPGTAGEADVGQTTAAVMMGNGIGANRLFAGGLADRALVSQRLQGGILIAGELDGVKVEERDRSLLSYIARCALRDGDVLQVDRGRQTYWFPGRFGLATGWETRGLTAAEEEGVSACLIAHANAYGVSVWLSGRMIDWLGADAGERATYRSYEGSFFGHVFATPGEGDPIALYACQGDSAVIARAHSPIDRRRRVCTDGHPGCGAIEALGRCRDVCERYVDGYGWTDCWGDGVRYERVFSAFLADGDPDRADMACGAGGRCTAGRALVTEAGKAGMRAIASCRDAVDCAATCSAGDICTLDGTRATGEFIATVGEGAVAKVAAYRAASVNVACDGAGARCEIDCKRAGTCLARCAAGASCLLECAGAEGCGFTECGDPRGVQVCDGGVQVCGSACP